MTSYRSDWRPTEEQKERNRRVRIRRATLRRQIRREQLKKLIAGTSTYPKLED
jgi:hypothetical protein